jgi:large subunit ribosomal protein L21
MYAVVKTGGKQYRVEKEDVVLVEKLDANDGDQVILDNILMIGEGRKVTLGSPLISDAAVMAQVIRQTRGPKITMIYKRRRKNSRRKQGHKQNLTLLKIIDIAETGGSKLLPKKAVAKAVQTKPKAPVKPTEAKIKTTTKPAETKVKASDKPTATKAKVSAKPAATKAKATAKTENSTTKYK